jgi:hypothetical protein
MATRHALITWIPNSVDGKREAQRLHKLYSSYATIEQPERLTRLHDYTSLIVVGHRSEFQQQGVRSSLRQLFGDEQSVAHGCGWLVLAICRGAVGNYHGALAEGNECLAPARAFAEWAKIKVSGTMRELTFDEVGRGTAFTLVHGELLIRADPPGSPGLWRDFEPGAASVDELAEGISRL